VIRYDTKENRAMPDLYHNVPINASADKVYAAVATQRGMQGWWTRDTTMTPKVGASAEFRFDKRGMVFRMTIDEMKPNQLVRMSCSGDQPEWAGTTQEWRIEPSPSGCVLKFTHRGWREMTDFCSGCNSMWGQLMFRLKAYVETGKANPQWND
jgi:uncharacterized protein YndB with AHSA1/START domain